MAFRETLDEHLCAIQARDLDALVATLPQNDDALVLITAEGRLVRSVAAFVALHRDWFDSPDWTLDTEPVSIFESPDLAVATLRLDYREDRPDGPLHVPSLLTLVFARRGDRWVMVQDQNTPIKRSGAE